MTPSELSAIRARLDAATPGPWEAGTAACCPDMGWVDGPKGAVCPQFTATKVTHSLDANDAELIAHAPTDLRALLDEVERLTAELDTKSYQMTTVATFQFPNGRWGWFVTPGPLAGGPPQDTMYDAEKAGEAYAKLVGWPEPGRYLAGKDKP